MVVPVAVLFCGHIHFTVKYFCKLLALIAPTTSCP